MFFHFSPFVWWVVSKWEERNYLTFKKTYICFWWVWMKNAQLTLLFSCLERKKIMLLFGHDYWVKHVMISNQAFILILRICTVLGLSITVWILSLLQHLSGLSSSAYCQLYFCIATEILTTIIIQFLPVSWFYAVMNRDLLLFSFWIL